MNIKVARRNGAASFGAQVPLCLEDVAAHEFYGHGQDTFWDDLFICKGWHLVKCTVTQIISIRAIDMSSLESMT